MRREAAVAGADCAEAAPGKETSAAAAAESPIEAREMVQIAIRPDLPDQGEDRLRAYGYRRIYHRFGAT
jgi:hypothetical protein